MRSKVSLVFTVLLVVVMLGVVFGILTNSRNSILVKEMFYVAGGSLAALFAAVLLFVGTPSYTHRIPKISLLSIGAVILLMVVTHFFGTSSPNGPFTFLMLLSLFALVVSSLLFMDHVHIRLFTSIFIGSVSLMFLYAIMQWQGINIFAWDAALTRSGRSTGSLGNPNLLGGFAAALIPLGAAHLLSLKKLSPVLRVSLALVFVALSATTVVASGTRGSLIGVAAGSTVLLAWLLKTNAKSKKVLIPLVLIFAALIASVALPMTSRLSELDPAVENQGTLQVRKIIWSGAFDLFLRSPLVGHGPGSFQILFPEVRNPDYNLMGVSHNTLHAHCEYLEILVDIGIAGLALWALAAWGLFARFKKADLLMVGAMAGMLAMLAEGFVSVHLRWPPTAWLFATLSIIFLAGEDQPLKTPSKNRLGSFIFLFAGIVLASGFFVHYIPMAKSSILVFKGKDLFLVRTERAMNGAYSAASRWAANGDPSALNSALTQWQSAAVYADSAVDYSAQAIEVYPYDLGAWYALGSANLTRYMIMSPPVPAMTLALEEVGLSGRYSEQEVRQELAAGMAAYDSLMTMAPNYSEVHNNLALGFSNLGMLDESMTEIYRAYNLHGHRREDYYNQVSALLMVAPNSYDGALLYFSHSITGFDIEASGYKLEKNYESLLLNAWYLVTIQPENSDDLKEEFCRLIVAGLPVEHSDFLIQRMAEVENRSPFRDYYSQDLLTMNDTEALQSLRDMSVSAAYNGSSFPTALPAERSYYLFPAEIIAHSDWDSEIFKDAMSIFFYQIISDRKLDDANSILFSERFNEVVDPEVTSSIMAVRMAMGGSRTAMRNGLETSWLEGSFPDVVSDSLHSRMLSDSLNCKWYRMELRMTFLLVTSYWWDANIFASAQNQYLLDRIFYCRDMIRELQPSCWPSIVSNVLSEEIDRISSQTSGQCPATVGILRDDLVAGADRAPN